MQSLVRMEPRESVIQHIKTFVFRGLLAMIPFGLAYVVIRILYVSIDQRIAGALQEHIGIGFPGLGLLLLLISMYLLGLLASNYLGRKTLNIVEDVTRRIPLVKTVYGIGKQISDSIGRSGQEVFKRPILVRAFGTDTWSVGFVTGSVEDAKAPEGAYLKVYVPLPPNPTSGMLLIVRAADTRDPGWTVEEALTCVMSGGIIGPRAFG